jgi:hypothetical protein
MILTDTKKEGNEITTENFCEQGTLRTQLGLKAPHFRIRDADCLLLKIYSQEREKQTQT